MEKQKGEYYVATKFKLWIFHEILLAWLTLNLLAPTTVGARINP